MAVFEINGNGGGNAIEVSERIIPILSSDSTTATGTPHLYVRESSTYAAFKAFDQNFSTWCGNTAKTSSLTTNFIAYKFTASPQASLAIVCSSGNISNVYIEGSDNFVDYNNKGDCTVISDVISLTDNVMKVIPLKTTKAYQTYILNWDLTSSKTGIRLFQLF